MSINAACLNWAAALSACVLIGPQIAPVPSQPDSLKFVVLGDMPYSKQEAEALRTDLKAAISTVEVPFVIHYGDFKAGNESCTDELFAQTKAEMDRLHPRVFFTPGDNDWTDCDRPGLLHPKSELERLDALRSLFFSQETAPSFTRQVNYPENARWRQDNVVFTTLHIVGTNNGRTQILKDDPKSAIAQVAARDQANQAWLAEAFANARNHNAQSLVIVIQADISKGKGDPCRPEQGEGCDAYSNFREQLKQEASQFIHTDQTRKPVLLVHGDTFPYCWDKTLGGETAPNLWRLNAWGDFQQPADVTTITFQPKQPHQPFVAQTLRHQITPEVCEE